MSIAEAWYANAGWSVTDVFVRNRDEEGTPYDLLCESNSEVGHVEVKGANLPGFPGSTDWAGLGALLRETRI